VQQVTIAFINGSVQGSYHLLPGSPGPPKTTEMPRFVSTLPQHPNKENSRALQEDNIQKVIAGTQINCSF